MIGAFFFLSSRAETSQIKKLAEKGKGVVKEVIKDRDYLGYSRLIVKLGDETSYDKASVRRLLKRKPRLSIEPPKLIPESSNYDLSSLAPFVLCCGSGLSSESGLPFLGEIHNLFDLDDNEGDNFIFGASDNLPERLAENKDGEFRKYCQFTVDAVKAEPSDSHRLLANLFKKGYIKQIFTDNMDDLFAKVGLPYTQTRLSIFPDRFEADFDDRAKAILVVGVAVDRRQVVRQARRKGLKIIVVNPVYEVACKSRNLDYLYKGDIFFRGEAKEVLPKIISASGF